MPTAVDPTALRARGRYVGEARLRLEFRGERGPEYGWLLVEPETLAERARAAGWRCEVLTRGTGGDYLARLTEVATGGGGDG